MGKKFWNFIKNLANEDEVELRIEGEIVADDDSWFYEWLGIAATTPNAFKEELFQNKGKNITVWIDSFGGDFFAGVGIYNALMEFKKSGGKVTVKIDTKAMSAATMPAMAGDEVLIAPGGIMMIHNPWTIAQGEAKDMENAAEYLNEVKEAIINIYQLRTGKSRKKLSEMMDNETFMSARTAIQEGFADKMLYSDSSLDSATEPIENTFMFSRLAIQNSMVNSMKKFIEIAKSHSQPPAPEPLQAVNNKKTSKEGDEPMFKDVNELRNACPDLVKQIEDAAREEGRKEERARIQEIEQIANTIKPELVNRAKFEQPMDAKTLAFEAMKQNAMLGQQFMQNLNADNNDSNVNAIQGQNADAGDGDGNKPKTVKDRFKNIAANIDAKRRGVKSE